ncbi:MAG: hypothetical protein SGILL_003848 [Bacillariaceae sp.]
MVPTPNDDAPRIKVLMCTANMGNEQPDVDSLNAWIPKDGDTSLVLKDQKYPIREIVKEKFKSAVHTLMTHAVPHGDEIFVNADSQDSEVVPERFDIIAIGMQEATFEVEHGEKKKNLVHNVKKLTSQVTDLTATSNYQKADKNIATAGIRKINSIMRGDSPKPKRTESGASEKSMSPTKGSSLHPSERKAQEASKRGDEDTQILHQMLQEQLPSYTRAVSYQRGQMRLMVFSSSDTTLDVLGVKAQNTGMAGLANKGGIVAELHVNNNLRLSVLSAHLEAHETEAKYKIRCSTIGDIFRGTYSSVTDFHCDVSLSSHYTFVMGDLNFRTRLPDVEPGSQEHVEKTHLLAEKKDWDTIYQHDELTQAIQKNDCLAGFKTLKCSFPCTFKVHRMEGYKYNEKRSPSYTDRVLYKANHLLSDKIHPLAYESIDSFQSSDHKPVRFACEITTNPVQRWRPVLTKTHHSFRAAQKKGKKLRGASFGKRDSPSAEKRENLHIFVSSIECNIDSEKFSQENMPNTYVSFVSTPRDAVKKDVSRKEKLRNFFGLSSSKRLKDEDKPQVQNGWPRTKRAKHTCNPQWPDEIHFKVRTHDDAGKPVDLTGALLHVLLFEDKENGHLIGSATLNLAHLVSVSSKDKNKSIDHSAKDEKPSAMTTFVINQLFNHFRGQDASHKEAKTQDEEKTDAPNFKSSPIPTTDEPIKEEEEVPTDVAQRSSISELNHPRVVEAQSSEDDMATVFNAKGPSKALRSAYRRTSIFSSSSQKITQNILKKSFEATPGQAASTLDNLGIHSLTIDEPLSKNGRNVGRIKFTIDAWWLDSSKSTNMETLSPSRSNHRSR